MTSQILLTEPEAAERLRICARVLRKARKEGRLHYVLIGSSVRYTVDDLESFVASHRKVNAPCPVRKPPARSNARTGKGAEIIPFTVRNAGR